MSTPIAMPKLVAAAGAGALVGTADDDALDGADADEADDADCAGADVGAGAAVGAAHAATTIRTSASPRIKRTRELVRIIFSSSQRNQMSRSIGVRLKTSEYFWLSAIFSF